MKDLQITPSKQPCPLVQGPDKGWWLMISAVASEVFPQFQSTFAKAQWTSVTHQQWGSTSLLPKWSGSNKNTGGICWAGSWLFRCVCIVYFWAKVLASKLRQDQLHFPSSGFSTCPKPLWWWSACSDLLANEVGSVATFHVERARDQVWGPALLSLSDNQSSRKFDILPLSYTKLHNWPDRKQLGRLSASWLLRCASISS